ncbi:Metal cation symporter ZIP14 [Halotydeus destructor]|nr:Metal cation symporter ZIP14 [Halotydeus destructor]
MWKLEILCILLAVICVDHLNGHEHASNQAGHEIRELGYGNSLLVATLEEMQAVTFFNLVRFSSKSNNTNHKSLLTKSAILDQNETRNLVTSLFEQVDIHESPLDCRQLSIDYVTSINASEGSPTARRLQSLCESTNQCLDVDRIMSSLEKNQSLTETITKLSGHLLLTPKCLDTDEQHDHSHAHAHQGRKPGRHGHGRPSASEIWIYGLVCISFISLGSLVGVILMPLLHQAYFDKVLNFCEGFAVGSLAASSLFHLIPHVLDIHGYDFVYKCLLIFAGIYLFFLSETIGRLVASYRHDRSRTEYRVSQLTPSPNNNMKSASTSAQVEDKVQDKEHQHRVESLAYMIIFGDGLHNFIDGLSVGAAFTDSLVAGISVSLAVVCEELPHELGDFAVLLSSGMSWKRALTCNFLSACTAYLGLAVGIVLANFNRTFGDYIRAIAAGMFLYIALVGLMSKLTKSIKPEAKFKSNLVVFALQNTGIICGVTLLFFFATYEHLISGHSH